jgi:hypothetical protein
MRHMTPSGWLTAIALPIVVIFTFVFWYYRKRYPIADRHPWYVSRNYPPSADWCGCVNPHRRINRMGIIVGCLVIVADIMQLNDSFQPIPANINDKKCSLPLLTIHVFLIPYGICTFVLRTWLLLFRVRCIH